MYLIYLSRKAAQARIDKAFTDALKQKLLHPDTQSYATVKVHPDFDKFAVPVAVPFRSLFTEAELAKAKLLTEDWDPLPPAPPEIILPATEEG